MYNWLLEEWFSHFENLGDAIRRKLQCMSITSILRMVPEPDYSNFILNHLQLLMNMWVNVVLELRGEEENDVNVDCLVYGNTGRALSYVESPEDARRRNMTLTDIVHTVRLPGYIRTHLQEAVNACEGKFEEEWLVNVDLDVVKAFMGLGIMQ
jgi:hypothetical protein